MWTTQKTAGQIDLVKDFSLSVYRKARGQQRSWGRASCGRFDRGGLAGDLQLVPSQGTSWERTHLSMSPQALTTLH